MWAVMGLFKVTSEMTLAGTPLIRLASRRQKSLPIGSQVGCPRSAPRTVERKAAKGKYHGRLRFRWK